MKITVEVSEKAYAGLQRLAADADMANPEEYLQTSVMAFEDDHAVEAARIVHKLLRAQQTAKRCVGRA